MEFVKQETHKQVTHFAVVFFISQGTFSGFDEGILQFFFAQHTLSGDGLYSSLAKYSVIQLKIKQDTCNESAFCPGLGA
jgi:hypothetical protein